MAKTRTSGQALAALVVGVGVAALAGAEGPPAVLRESTKAGATTRVLVTLKAEGLYRPGPPAGAEAAKAEPAKPLALKVETRLDFVERVVDAGPDGRARRAVRRVVQAASAINGEVRPTASALRPEVALLVAEPRAGGVAVFSAGGPLTRAELELVQGAGDPLTLADALPDRPVKVGESWTVGAAAARSFSAYDTLIDNALKAKLESADDRTARVRFTGQVHGSVLGAEGKMLFVGSLEFDRQAQRVSRLSLSRSEARRPGAVEAGLEVKSTLSVDRKPADPPAELADGVLSGLSLAPDPLREELVLFSPNGKYSLRHDRDWHTYWDDTRQTVLKRLDKGTVVAQCNLAMGPNAGKGKRQNLEQFRGDLRKALGPRFGEFTGEGEVEGDPAGGFRYKVSVRGREGDLGVVWYYYLVASPDGDQLLGTFTLAEAQAQSFADQDVRLIGSLRWKDAPEAAAAAAGR